MSDVVQFFYRNHKGREAIRTVRPIRIWFGSTAWHQEAQWLLEGWDLDKQSTRDYAFANMLSSWQKYTPDKEVRKDGTEPNTPTSPEQGNNG